MTLSTREWSKDESRVNNKTTALTALSEILNAIKTGYTWTIEKNTFKKTQLSPKTRELM